MPDDNLTEDRFLLRLVEICEASETVPEKVVSIIAAVQTECSAHNAFYVHKNLTTKRVSLFGINGEIKDSRTGIYGWFSTICKEESWVAGLQKVEPSALPKELVEEWGEYFSRNLWVHVAGNSRYKTYLFISARQVMSTAQSQAINEAARIGSLIFLLSRRAKIWTLPFERKVVFAFVAFVFLLVMCLPVKLTATARGIVSSAEVHSITPRQEGVVSKILIDNGERVKAGDILFTLINEELLAHAETLESEMLVAESNLLSARQSRSADRLRQAPIESLRLKFENARLASEFAERSVDYLNVRAMSDGIVILESSKAEIDGRFVRPGDRLASVLNPSQLSLTAYVSPHDLAPVRLGAKAKFYLDSSLVSGLDGVVEAFDVRPRDHKDFGYSLQLKIVLTTASDDLSLGGTGVVKIYGEDVSLFYYLFRKPMTWLQHTVGW